MEFPVAHTFLLRSVPTPFAPAVAVALAVALPSAAQAQNSRGFAGSLTRSVDQAVRTGNTGNNAVAVGVNRTQTNTGGSNTVVNTTPNTAINRGSATQGVSPSAGDGRSSAGSGPMSTK